MTTLEGNKLIAEFMGNKRNQEYSGGSGRLKHWTIEQFGWFDDSELKYHTSWDWLMPVVGKIESLHDGLCSFFIVQKECDIAFSSKYKENGDDWDAPTFVHKKGDKLLSTWSSVVQFIQWYSKQTEVHKYPHGHTMP